MKAKSITVLLLLSALFEWTNPLTAQEFVQYEYDDAGNRISRRVIVIPPKLSVEDSLALTRQISGNSFIPVVLTETMEGCQVRIYPNPTGGEFTLEIEGTYNISASKLRLFNLSGSELQTWENLHQSNRIDIRKFTSGTYLLVLYLHNSTSSWKLIKE